MNRTIQALLTGTALATVGLAPTMGHAQQGQQQLLNRVDTLEKELKAVKEQLREQEKKKAEGPGFKVSTAGGVTVESKDGKFSGHVGGRIFVDTAFYNEDKTRLGDGAEFRTLRLDVAGKTFYDFPYKVQVDFAGNGTKIKDTFFGYSGWKPFEFVIGNFLPPISLDALVSSKYTTFMEPALPGQFLQEGPLGRRLGAQATARGDIWTATAGVFSAIAADAAPGETDSGWVAAARVTVAPIMTKQAVVHLGFGVEDANPKAETWTLGYKPESHFTGAKFINTGNINVGGVVKDMVTYQPELAVVYGPVHAETEYQWTHVSRSAGGGDLNFHGWYVQGGWFITGEMRHYQLKDTPYSANFGRVHPKHNIGEGGFGALEVAARWSGLDLSDGNVRGGTERNITLGLNWYLNPFVRVMFNYVKVNNDNEATGNAGGGAGVGGNLIPGKTNGRDDDPSIYEMRAQIDF